MADDDELQTRIAAFVSRQTGADVRVEGLRRLTGGASRETWSLDAIVERGGASETLPLILQRDVRGAPKSLSRPDEFRLMKAAFYEFLNHCQITSKESEVTILGKSLYDAQIRGHWTGAGYFQAFG